MDPCGVSNKISFQELYSEFILVLCFLLLGGLARDWSVKRVPKIFLLLIVNSSSIDKETMLWIKSFPEFLLIFRKEPFTLFWDLLKHKSFIEFLKYLINYWLVGNSHLNFLNLFYEQVLYLLILMLMETLIELCYY